MAVKKTHKRKKVSRQHGRKMGTHGGGARKKRKKSGHRGGAGMSGSGKRSDHKKTLVTKKYGHGYFGKKGITSMGTKRDKRNRINLREIESNLEKYGKRSGSGWEINLKDYKILGETDGELKHKLTIKVKEASKSAIEKVKRVGGEIILPTSSSKSRAKAGGEILLAKKSVKMKEKEASVKKSE